MPFVDKRSADVQRRAAQPDRHAAQCHVLGCRSPSSAAAGRGLNRKFCRRHEDHFERHGSYFRRSYTAAEVRPWRRMALSWLDDPANHARSQPAVAALTRLLRDAGAPIDATRLRGLSPQKRAHAALARVRQAGVTATDLLATSMAVQAAIRADRTPDLRPEFRHVQVAKLVHRLASGFHRNWPVHGTTRQLEVHKYPASRGRVLRHLGAALVEACSAVDGVDLSTGARN